MNVFENVDEEIKKQIVEIWKVMSETQKMHFINQVALVLSVWGSDAVGKKLAVDVLAKMVKDGSSDLSDFGLYLDRLRTPEDAEGRKKKVERASLVLEGYRIKNELTSEPHKELEL